MKKLIAVVAVSALMLSGSLAYATVSGTTNPEYNPYTLTAELNFAAVLNSAGKVETSWDSYMPANFNYYKVVRSQTNQDPVYPDDGYIFVGGSGDNSYLDTSAPTGISYYRVCSIAKPERYCSPVVTIEKEGGEEGTQETTEPVDPDSLAEIVLEGSVNEDGTVDLSWTVDDNEKITAGFKIVYSKINEEPVYPGDSYAYLTDSGLRAHKLQGLKAGYTYHIRACQYNGNGVCLAYSNTITAAISGTASAEAQAGDVDFKDTKEHWAEAYADNLKNSCGVLGYKNQEGEPTGYFRPDSPITRAELAKMLVNCAYGELEAAKVDSYADVDPDSWYAAYVYKAKKLGWVEGYGDGTFRPSNNVNRAEALKMILASKIAVELITGGVIDFKDISGNEWFVDYVAYAVAEDIVGGYGDGTFKPGNTITRAEAAKIISLVYGL